MLLSLVIASCSDDEQGTPVVTPSATGIMTDIDGNDYPYVRIGGLDWMAHNLNSGEPWYWQTYLTDNDIEYDFEVDDEDAEAELCAQRGNFYTYQQALDQCPDGWRLPTDDDWKQLEIALGMSRQETDKTGWRSGAGFLMVQSAEEGTGLGMKYAGLIAAYSTAAFDKYHVGDYGYYWTATRDNNIANPCAYIRKITPVMNSVYRAACPINRFMSVRYVRDAQ